MTVGAACSWHGWKVLYLEGGSGAGRRSQGKCGVVSSFLTSGTLEVRWGEAGLVVPLVAKTI